MSTPFYDLASLVVVPSGYKASKVYAQKPLTTDGQLTFSRASTATRVNASGLIETVSSGVPRLDYQGSSCPKLNLEPQRTNLVIHSEDFPNWSNAGGTVTSNTAISPDGTQNADTLTGARFQSSYSSDTYTGSCFAKKVDGDNKLVLRFDVPSLKFAQFDLGTGAIDSVSSGYSATITPYGNGWYRCTFTSPAATAISNFVIISASGGASNTYVWGGMLEVGSYATSYVKTTTAAVTRLADACSKTGISSLIGQTEGTIFGEIEVVLGTTNMLAWMRKLSGGLYNDIILAYVSSTGIPNAQVDVGGISQVTISGASALTAGYHKVAFAYKQNDFVLYVDGVQIGNDTTGTVPACDEFYIDQYIDGGNRNATKKQFLLFKTRLTNAQLAEITAL